MNKDLQYFITFELLCIGYYAYETSILNCTPCPPNTTCPPCESDQQTIIFWMAILGAVIFLIKKTFVWVNKKQ